MKTLTMTLTEQEVSAIESALVYLHNLALEDVNVLDDVLELGDLQTAKALVDHKEAVRRTEAIYKALKEGVLRAGG